MLDERTFAEPPPNKKNHLAADTGSITVVIDNGHAATNGDAPAGSPPAIPGYEILGLLGRGAKGVVYQARQLQLNRLVALKMILAGPHASISDVLRFMGEAEAVAHLHHPNIVQIHEVNQHDGLPYFVLEYIDGGSLQQKMRGAPVAPAEAAQLLETLARATHAAHEAGIVHRDLKPGNVLLTVSGQPKITDFGLAKRLEPGNSLTGSKDVLGTPSYMAPEQADGMGGKVGPRSDVYALGAILYELLTGRPPFRGVTTMDTLRQVVSEEPVPPRRLQPKVPPDLETICLKALGKEPNRRYATAADLADDLHRYIRREPIKARPASAVERIWRWMRRNPVIASLLMLTIFSIVLGFLLVFKAYRSESWQRHRAEIRLADKELTTGITLSEQGNPHDGQLWMARALRHVPPGAHDLERTIRISMGTWRAQLHQLEAIFQLPGNDSAPIPDLYVGRLRKAIPVNTVAYSSDGKYVLTGGFGGFAARLWQVDGGQPVRSFLHDGPVLTVACSPDGRYVLTGSQKKTTGEEAQRGVATLWNLNTGEEVRSFPHSLPVFAVAFSPDGRKILTGGRSGEVYLWDVETGKQLGSFPHSVPIRSLAFHPDGNIFATAPGESPEHKDNSVRIWDIRTGEMIVEPLHHRGPVHAVAFSPNGKVLATACSDRAAYLWRTNRFAAFGLPLWHDEAVTCVVFSPDGKTILTGSRDRTVRAWDADTGKQRGAPLLHQDEVFAVAYSRDNQSVLVGCRDGSARRWRVLPHKPAPPAFLHNDSVLAVAISPNDEIVATGSRDGVFDLWNASTGSWIHPSGAQHSGAVVSIRFSRNGQHVLSVSDDAKVMIWDPVAARHLQTLKHPGKIRTAVFSPDGKFVATGCEDGQTRLWEVESGKLVWNARHRQGVKAVAFDAIGSILFAASEDGQACGWDVATGQMNGTPMEHGRGIDSLAVSADGQTMLTGCVDGTAWLWNLSTRKSRQLSPSHRSAVHIVAFTNSGNTALTCSMDGLARLWTVESGRPIGLPLQHQPVVLTAVFSPDGSLVLVGSQDHKAYLWSAETGKPIGPPLAHKGPVSAAAFNSAGTTILTGSYDRSARMWELPPPVEGAAADVELHLAVFLGAELDDTGGLNFLSADEWKDRCGQWNARVKR